jgi:polysaccharide biosynthesis transport protein
MLDRPADMPGNVAPPVRHVPDVVPAGVSIRLILSILRRRKWAALGCMVFVPACAWLALSQVTPRYTATGAVLYEPSEYKVRELQSILRAEPTTEAVMASQAEVLHSLHIAQRVAERGNLYDRAEFNPAHRPPGPWHRLVVDMRWLLGMEPEPPPAPNSGPRLEPERNATLMAVREALHAVPVRFSHVIEVSFTSEDAAVAAAGVNNAMDTYVREQLGAKTREVRKATDLLEKRAAELRTEVKRAEDAIATYRARHALSQGMHAGLDAEQVTHLTEDLVRARGELAAADARLDAARGRAGAAAQAAVAPSVAQLRAQQSRVAGETEARQARLGPNHPETAGLRRQKDELRMAVEAEIARVVAATDSERHAAAERVTTLEANLERARQEEDRNAQAQVALNALIRDAEAGRSELQAVLGRIQQTAQQSAIEVPDAHEISLALPPEHPSWPRTGPIMAAAMATGTFLGLMLAYLLHLADGTINCGDDVRAATGLPCFALLPEVSRRALRHLSVEDYATRRPLTAYAEQVRAVRAGLWLNANRPRVIAVVAARAAEGKTVLSLSLARSAHLAGDRVITVECDLRRPSFARRFRTEASPGLAEAACGKAALEDTIRRDPMTGMHILPAGKPDGDLVGLFLSGVMASVLATLRTQYDIVVLDAPPVQAMTEARIIAALADATLLCVRWRSTPRDVLLHAVAVLEDAHAHVAGTVLTRVDPRAHVRSGSADAEVYHRRYRTYYEG